MLRSCVAVPAASSFFSSHGFSSKDLKKGRKIEGKRTGVINIGTPSLLINLAVCPEHQ
ncbi:hypothetical protein ACE6H2_011847 [Prunus campanulata]